VKLVIVGALPKGCSKRCRRDSSGLYFESGGWHVLERIQSLPNGGRKRHDVESAAVVARIKPYSSWGEYGLHVAEKSEMS